MTTVNIGGMDELRRAMGRLSGPLLNQAMQRAGEKLAETAKRILMSYPGPSHQPVKWASAKQRRWYFAMRRAQGLPMEYTRMSDPMSQDLQHSWQVAKLPNGAMVGTRVGYASWVQAAESQSPQHKATGWGTDQQAIDELNRRNLIDKVVMAEVDSLVKKAFRR